MDINGETLDMGSAEMGQVPGNGGGADSIGAGLDAEACSRELEHRVAMAIYEGLKRRPKWHWGHNYVSGEPAPHCRTNITGQFHLMAIARHVLAALHDPPS